MGSTSIAKPHTGRKRKKSCSPAMQNPTLAPFFPIGQPVQWECQATISQTQNLGDAAISCKGLWAPFSTRCRHCPPKLRPRSPESNGHLHFPPSLTVSLVDSDVRSINSRGQNIGRGGNLRIVEQIPNMLEVTGAIADSHIDMAYKQSINNTLRDWLSTSMTQS